MKSLVNRLCRFSLPDWSAPFVLLGACILAYGLLIPWLGLYSDDWVFLSTYNKMGSAGLTRYFTTNRPFWGLFYQVTLPAIGTAPWRWHVFSLLWHWAAAVSVWWLVRLVWHRAREAALWVGLLFAVHPAFLLQPIALTVGHMYLVYTAFVLSICLLVLALREREGGEIRGWRFWTYAILAFIVSAVNLLSMEYFLLMHLLQPVFLWFTMGQMEADLKIRFRKVIQLWWPYLLLLSAVLTWRIFLFPYQTQNYQYLFLDQLRLSPGTAVISLLGKMLNDWLATGLGAWLRPFVLNFQGSGERVDLVYLVLALGSASAIGITLLFSGGRRASKGGIEGERGNQGAPQSAGLQMVAAGGLGLVVAGAPFWLTDIPVGIESFHSRFAMPFIFGASFLVGGLILAIPMPRWTKVLVLALLLGFGISSQFREQNFFRREWIVQKDLYWQLAWRMPELEPGTVVFSAELPLEYNASDYTQSAMFDWIWKPDPAPQVMDYAYYYPNERLLFGSMQAYGANHSVAVDHLGAVFEGNTNQSIVVQVNDPEALTVGCLHIMNPNIDANNPFFPKLERELISYSDPSLIMAEHPAQTKTLFPGLFGKEPPPSHCYYFQKIDLAYQLGEYAQAVEYYQQAVEAGYGSWLDTELVPVIASFAHLGEWDQAFTLTNQMSKRSFYPLGTYVCNLWEILEEEIPQNDAKTVTLSRIQDRYACGD